MMAYVATTTQLDTSIFCLSSEEGRNVYWPSQTTIIRSVDRLTFTI